MKPLKWARVSYSRHAWAVREAMSDEERARLRNIISVIKMSPEDGPVFMEDADGDGIPLRQKTGGNMHVVYKVVFWPVGRVLQVAFIEIRDWIPRHMDS